MKQSGNPLNPARDEQVAERLEAVRAKLRRFGIEPSERGTSVAASDAEAVAERLEAVRAKLHQHETVAESVAREGLDDELARQRAKRRRRSGTLNIRRPLK